MLNESLSVNILLRFYTCINTRLHALGICFLFIKQLLESIDTQQQQEQQHTTVSTIPTTYNNYINYRIATTTLTHLIILPH